MLELEDIEEEYEQLRDICDGVFDATKNAYQNLQMFEGEFRDADRSERPLIALRMIRELRTFYSEVHYFACELQAKSGLSEEEQKLVALDQLEAGVKDILEGHGNSPFIPRGKASYARRKHSRLEIVTLCAALGAVETLHSVGVSKTDADYEVAEILVQAGVVSLDFDGEKLQRFRNKTLKRMNNPEFDGLVRKHTRDYSALLESDPERAMAFAKYWCEKYVYPNFL